MIIGPKVPAMTRPVYEMDEAGTVTETTDTTRVVYATIRFMYETTRAMYGTAKAV